MDFKNILRALGPLKNRIHLNNAFFALCVGILAAGGVSLLLAAIALFLPIPFLLQWILRIYTGGTVLSLLMALFLRPGELTVLKTADSLGLKERLITACELKQDTTALAAIQRQDTLRAVAKTDFRVLYPLRFPKRTAIVSGSVAVLILITLLLPVPAKNKALELEELLTEVRKQAQKLEKKKKEISRESKLSAEKLEELNRRTDELLKELEKARNQNEALKALAKAKHELEELKAKPEGMELTKLAEKLSQSLLAKELANSMKNGNLSDLKQKLEQLAEKAGAADDKTRNELVESLKKAAADSENRELADSLNSLSQAMEAGDTSAAKSSSRTLANSLSSLAESSPSDGDAQPGEEDLELLLQAMENAKQQISGKGAQNRQTAKGQPGGGQGQQGNGAGGGQGSQGGQGQGNTPGNKGGGGAGNQIGNKDLGYSGEETGGGKRDPGARQEKEYESVFVPERLGGDAEQSQVKGQKGESGFSRWAETDNVPVQKGNALPYDKVLGQYREEAMSGLQESSIPPGMRDIVRDYFSSLE